LGKVFPQLKRKTGIILLGLKRESLALLINVLCDLLQASISVESSKGLNVVPTIFIQPFSVTFKEKIYTYLQTKKITFKENSLNSCFYVDPNRFWNVKTINVETNWHSINAKEFQNVSICRLRVKKIIFNSMQVPGIQARALVKFHAGLYTAWVFAL